MLHALSTRCQLQRMSRAMLLVKGTPIKLSLPFLRMTSTLTQKCPARRRLACTSCAAASNTDKDVEHQVGTGHRFAVDVGEELMAYQEELYLARRQLSADVYVTHVLDVAVQARTAVRPVSDAVATLQLLQKVSALASNNVLNDSKLDTTPAAAVSTKAQPSKSDVGALNPVSSGAARPEAAKSIPQTEIASALKSTADSALGQLRTGDLSRGMDLMAAQLATAAVARMLRTAADKASDVVKMGETQPSLTQVEGWQKVLDAAAEAGKAADAVHRAVQLGEEALAQLGKETAAAIIEKIAKEKQPPRVATEVKVAISNSVQATAIMDTAVAAAVKAVAAVNAVALAVADVPLGSPSVATAAREMAKATTVLQVTIEEISVLEAACTAATAMHEVMLSLLCVGRGSVRVAVEAWQHAGAEAARQVKASTAAAAQAAAESASEIEAVALAMATVTPYDTEPGNPAQAAEEAMMNCKACTEAAERVLALSRTASQAAAVWQYTAVVAAAVQGVGEATEAAAMRAAPAAVALAAARVREAGAAGMAMAQAAQAMEDAAVAMEASALAQVLGPIEAAAMLVNQTESGYVEELGAVADATDDNGGVNDWRAQASNTDPDLHCSHAVELAALAVVSAAEQEVSALVERHVKDSSVARGLVFEVHHAASFNLDAIRRGSGLRAERWEDGADIRVYDRIYAWATLARAQLKTARGGLGQSKYDGMQKVVAADIKLSSQTSHVLSCGGVSSRPLTVAALADVVQDPAAHFRGLLWWEPDSRQLGLLAGT